MTEDKVETEPVVETPPVENQAQEEVKDAPQEDNQSKNWKQAREVMSLQQKKIQELEEMVSKVAQPSKPPEEEDEFDKLDPSDYLTVEKARALAKKQAEKAAKQIVREELQKHSQETRVAQDEKRMKETQDDYDFVMENYAVPLIKKNPALAYQIQNSENPAEAAYLMAKMSTLYKENQKEAPDNPKKAEKILKNASRPVSGAAVGSPLKSQADNFSKMSKQDIWKMSQEYARGA